MCDKSACIIGKTMHVVGEVCHGGKRNKQHVTLFCANVNGTEK